MLNRSVRAIYDEHVSSLLTIPQLYLDEIKPNTQLHLSDILKRYNSDVANEADRYGRALQSEMVRITEKSGITLNSDLKSHIKLLVAKHVDPELYQKRFSIFIESIERHLSRYGIRFEKEKYRIDISESLAIVGAKNQCRKISSSIFNELDLHELKNGKVQIFNDIKTHITASQKIIKLEKKDNIMGTSPLSDKDIWNEIKNDFDISKRAFGKKINFVTDGFKRKIIFRDIGHAYVLANLGYSKPAVILAGSVIEELLRQYLVHKKIKPESNTFDSYIQTCVKKELLKSGISRLTDSVRHFRNIVHLHKEKDTKITISKATAKGAVTSIFTIANDF